MASSTDVPSPTLVSPVDVASPTLASRTDVPSPTFSTLEVDQRASYIHPPVQGLEVIKPEDEGLPQVVQPHIPKHHKSENDTSVSHSDANSKKLAGLSMKTIGLFIAVAILIALGGGLGGFFGARNSHDDTMVPTTEPSDVNITAITAPSPSSTSNVYILPNSNITATSIGNMDKPGDSHYRVVVFQGITGALIACVWRSAAKVWATENLTSRALNSIPINGMIGTPLASATLQDSAIWQVKVWCLHPNGGIVAITWPIFLQYDNHTYKDYIDRMGLWTIPLWESASNNSTSLAAYIRPDFDSEGKFFTRAYLAYQIEANRVATFMWGSEVEPLQLQKVFPSTDEASSHSHLYMYPPSEKFNSTSNHTLLIYESKGQWIERFLNLTDYYGELLKVSINQSRITNSADRFILQDSGMSVLNVEGLANDGYGSRGDIKQLITIPFFSYTVESTQFYLILLSNGTLLSMEETTNRAHEFRVPGKPSPNFTSIATTDDSRLYGIVGDEVLEYGCSISDDPYYLNITYIGRVYP